MTIRTEAELILQKIRELRKSIAEQLAACPDNPDLTRLSDSRGPFTISMSDSVEKKRVANEDGSSRIIAGNSNWLPSYHDSLWQVDQLIQALDTRDLNEMISLLAKVSETGTAHLSVGTVRFNLYVREYVGKIL